MATTASGLSISVRIAPNGVEFFAAWNASFEVAIFASEAEL
jgi:hypothetical protein